MKNINSNETKASKLGELKSNIFAIFIGITLGIYTIMLIYFYNRFNPTIWMTLFFLVLLSIGLLIANQISKRISNKDECKIHWVTFVTYVVIGIIYFLTRTL